QTQTDDRGGGLARHRRRRLHHLVLFRPACRRGNARRGGGFTAQAPGIRRCTGHAGQPDWSPRRAGPVSQGQGRARGQGREADRGDQAIDAARHRHLSDLSARAAGQRHQRIGGPVSGEGRIEPAGEVSLDDNSGIRAIIDSAMVSYERLPMLEIVFDRLVRLMTTSLRNFTSDNVEVSLDRITSVRFGDYMNSIPLPAVLSVFKAEEWENFGLATVDSSLIYSIIDVLLGGRRGQTSLRIEGRPYTTIETNLVKRL